MTALCAVVAAPASNRYKNASLLMGHVLTDSLSLMSNRKPDYTSEKTGEAEDEVFRNGGAAGGARTM